MTSLPTAGNHFHQLGGGTITILVWTKKGRLILESKHTQHTTITNHIRWMKHRQAMP